MQRVRFSAGGARGFWGRVTGQSIRSTLRIDACRRRISRTARRSSTWYGPSKTSAGVLFSGRPAVKLARACLYVLRPTGRAGTRCPLRTENVRHARPYCAANLAAFGVRVRRPMRGAAGDARMELLPVFGVEYTSCDVKQSSNFDSSTSLNYYPVHLSSLSSVSKAVYYNQIVENENKKNTQAILMLTIIIIIRRK